MAIEIVDFPMKNGWIFHSYVSLPEGICKVFIAFPGKNQLQKDGENWEGRKMGKYGSSSYIHDGYSTMSTFTGGVFFMIYPPYTLLNLVLLSVYDIYI